MRPDNSSGKLYYMSIQFNENEKSKALVNDIKTLIQQAKEKVANSAQSTLVILNWHIGTRINKVTLGQERGEYGKKIVENAAKELTLLYGRGFTRDNLFRMIQFAKTFLDFNRVISLAERLTWSHFVEIMILKDPMQREYYAEMCRIENWSSRTLHKKIQGMFFERTALSKNTDEFIKQELEQTRKENFITPNMIFKDPYLLDFLNLPRNFSENDLENAILDELSAFIQELGNDFCFVERQKRITIGGEDFRLDLLFFHRGLRRLICIELKISRFSAAHKGQMELYLKWLDKYERKAGEEAPLGIILCSEKNQEQVELLEVGKTGIHVAEYLTELPSKKLLENKLHQAISSARERLAHQQILSSDKDPKNDP